MSLLHFFYGLIVWESKKNSRKWWCRKNGLEGVSSHCEKRWPLTGPGLPTGQPGLGAGRGAAPKRCPPRNWAWSSAVRQKAPWASRGLTHLRPTTAVANHLTRGNWSLVHLHPRGWAASSLSSPARWQTGTPTAPEQTRPGALPSDHRWSRGHLSWTVWRRSPPPPGIYNKIVHSHGSGHEDPMWTWGPLLPGHIHDAEAEGRACLITLEACSSPPRSRGPRASGSAPGSSDPTQRPQLGQIWGGKSRCGWASERRQETSTNPNPNPNPTAPSLLQGCWVSLYWSCEHGIIVSAQHQAARPQRTNYDKEGALQHWLPWSATQDPHNQDNTAIPWSREDTAPRSNALSKNKNSAINVSLLCHIAGQSDKPESLTACVSASTAGPG